VVCVLLTDDLQGVVQNFLGCPGGREAKLFEECIEVVSKINFEKV
jgi:hypothetical protein